MRLGNAEDAKAASEQIGMAHKFVLSQLTETIGTSVTDTLGGSYTSTVGDSASSATSTSDSESRSTGTGSTSPSGAGVLPLRGGGSRSAQHGTSRGTSESASLTTGISTSTAWGVSTSRATGDSESLARSLQRSRELVVEPSELQRLPVTAMIVSHGAGAERRVLLADANPAIGALPVATLDPLGEPAEPDIMLSGQGSAPAEPIPAPRPNLGPPSPRPGWGKTQVRRGELELRTRVRIARQPVRLGHHQKARRTSARASEPRSTRRGSRTAYLRLPGDPG
jgi:hypothetical protein